MSNDQILTQKSFMLVTLALESQKRIYTNFSVLIQVVISKKHVKFNYLCAPKRAILQCCNE